jgi:hypothetical protein
VLLRTIAPLLSATIILSCSLQPTPGSVSMSFTWDKEPDGPVWVWVRVEERDKPLQAGKILASSGPHEYSPDSPLALELTGVPNGDRRHVVAEIRKEDSPTFPIVYYGISEPFELRAGEQVQVSVPAKLQTPEALATEASIELLFDGTQKTSVSKAQVVSASVLTRSAGASTFVLANDASFSVNARTFSVDDDSGACQKETREGQEWDRCEISEWNLLEGLEVNDQQYTVFAKFIDRYGYESSVYKASTMLDTSGPVALLASVTPDVAGPRGDVVLNVSFHEPLSDDSGTTELTAKPALPAGSVVVGPTRAGDSNAYFWTITLGESETGSPLEHRFAVDAVDDLGNTSLGTLLKDESGEPIVLIIDPTAPVLVAGEAIACSQLLFGLDDTGTELCFDFTIVEERPLEPQLEAGGVCVDSCPQVRLDSHALGIVMRRPEQDVPEENKIAFRYSYEVQSEDWGEVDKEVDISILWSDLAGNVLDAVLPATPRFDFVAPGALACLLTPNVGNESSVFSYSLTANELLAEPPELLVVGESPDLFATLPELSDDGYTYVWTQSAEHMESEQFTVAARLVDLAGNNSEGEPDAPVGGYICSHGASVDVEAPVLDAVSVTTSPEVKDSAGEPVLVVGDGGMLMVDLTILEAQLPTGSYPVVTIQKPGDPVELSLALWMDAGNGTYQAEYELTLDAVEHKGWEGAWPVRVVLEDAAGNQTMEEGVGGEDSVVAIDFTPPSAVCGLVPTTGGAPYKLSEKVTFVVSPLEPLWSEDDYVPEVIETLLPDPGGSFFVYEEGSAYRFSGTIGDWDNMGSLAVGVRLKDLVGNETPKGGDACLPSPEEVSWDADPISVSGISVVARYEDAQNPGSYIVTGNRARSDSQVVVTFTVDELPSLGTLKVTVGDDTASVFELDGKSYEYTYQLSGQGEDGDVLLVSASMEDGAGNFTFTSLGTVLLDYAPPALSAVPVFARCDNLESAFQDSGETNYVRLKKGYSCAYDYIASDKHPLGCNAANDAEAPVRVALATNEPLRESETSLWVDGGHELSVSPCESSSTFVTAYYTPEGDEPEGFGENSRVVHASLTDQAGNTSFLLDVGRFEFDFTPPDTPTVHVPNRIVYTRVPWGADGPNPLNDTDGIPRYSVRGEPGAVEPLTQVTVHASANCEDTTLGAGWSDSSGAFGSPLGVAQILELEGSDRAHVYVSTRDQAGNTSDSRPDLDGNQAGLVRDVEWVATLGGKIPGDSLNNPHSFESVRWFQGRMDQNDSLSLGASKGIATEGGAILTTEGTDISWSNASLPLSQDSSLGPCYGLAVAYDSARGRGVAFGGYHTQWDDPDGVPKESSGTWEWDGKWWRTILPTDPEMDGGPPASPYNALAYDQRRGVVVLASSYGESGSPLQVWEWNGRSWKAVGAPLAAKQIPTRRYASAMAYDSRRAVTVLFGGSDDDKEFDETWEYDGEGWRLILPDDPEGDGDPPPRMFHAMAYDEEREVVVLYGGISGAVKYSDTWEYDGTGWRLVPPSDPEADSNPPAMHSHSMSYDSTLNKTVLFGGNTSISGEEGDFWAWNGESWERLTPVIPGGGELPPQSSGVLLADPMRRQMLILGDKPLVNGDPHFGPDFWVCDMYECELRDPTIIPQPESACQMACAYDPVRSRLVMHGGVNIHGVKLNDTWEWRGDRWEQVPMEDTQPGEKPAAANNAAMVFDGQKELLYADAGYVDQLWSFDGEHWLEQQLVDPSADGAPDPRLDNYAAWDSTRHRLVMFFGNYAMSGPETWELGLVQESPGTLPDSYDWECVEPSDPEADGDPDKRLGLAMAYDASREKIVMHGGAYGSHVFSDTWEWDGSSWLEALADDSDALGPGPRSGHVLTYDATRQRTILSSGGSKAGGLPHDDLWEWDGNSWRMLEASDPDADGNPEGRTGHLLGSLPDKASLLMWGGFIPTGGTIPWSGQWGTLERPAHVSHFLFGAAGNCAKTSLDHFKATWVAGGTGPVDDPSYDGVGLYVWDQGRWTMVDSQSYNADQTGTLQWSTDEKVILDRILFGPQQEIVLAVAPLSPNLLSHSTIATDYVEAVVRYRLSEAELAYCDCAATCYNKQCGTDGCGGSCGTCDEDALCLDGKCCHPGECGPVCGACPEGHDCADGACLEKPVCCTECSGFGNCPNPEKPEEMCECSPLCVWSANCCPDMKEICGWQ